MNFNRINNDINNGISTISIKNIVEDYNTEDIVFDETYNNMEEIKWTYNRKCRFIDSIIHNYASFPIVAEKFDNNKLRIIDGKQRIETLVEFVGDLFELNSLSTDVSYTIKDRNGLPMKCKEKIIGKTYTQLSDFLQRNILRYCVPMILIYNYSDKDKLKQRYLLNENL